MLSELNLNEDNELIYKDTVLSRYATRRFSSSQNIASIASINSARGLRGSCKLASAGVGANPKKNWISVTFLGEFQAIGKK